MSVKWASDDQIALWAVNSRSETVFSKQAFKLYHYNTDYNTAKFRGDIPQMPADTYTPIMPCRPFRPKATARRPPT